MSGFIFGYGFQTIFISLLTYVTDAYNGPAMQHMGSRWYSGLEVQALLSFLAFS
jgi:hypothetical protein